MQNAYVSAQILTAVLEYRTKDLGLTYSRLAGMRLADKANIVWGYVNYDRAGCPDSRKSISGYVLMLNGAAVSWKSKLNLSWRYLLPG